MGAVYTIKWAGTNMVLGQAIGRQVNRVKQKSKMKRGLQLEIDNISCSCVHTVLT